MRFAQHLTNKQNYLFQRSDRLAYCWELRNLAFNVQHSYLGNAFQRITVLTIPTKKEKKDAEK